MDDYLVHMKILPASKKIFEIQRFYEKEIDNIHSVIVELKNVREDEVLTITFPFKYANDTNLLTEAFHRIYIDLQDIDKA